MSSEFLVKQTLIKIIENAYLIMKEKIINGLN